MRELRNSLRAISILLTYLCLPSVSDANSAPLSTEPSESALAAKLSPEELAARVGAHVAARVMSREKVVFDGRDDLQIQALLELGNVVGESKYLDVVLKIMERRQMPPDYVHSWKLEPFSSLSFNLYQRTCNKAYVVPLIAESRKYRAEALRAFDGIVSAYFDGIHERYKWNEDEPTHRFPSGDVYFRRDWRPIIIDQVQEYASRMAKTGWLTGDQDLYTEAAEQLVALRTALRDPATGLWGHARGYFGSEKTVASTKWGRGHAWLLRGLVETMTYLPPNSPQANRVMPILEELAAALLKHQDKDGFWHQVIDRPDSYQETSATGLISYYLARAVEQKLLPERPYRAAALNAFEAIARSKASADGTVYGGSETTPPMPSTVDYMNRKTPPDDAYAAAAVIYSAVGKLLLEQKDSASAESISTCR